MPVLLTVAWGALSFGAVYPWAYWPVMWGALLAGVLGMRARGSVRATLVAPLTLGLVALLAAILLQLVPLPSAVLKIVSPSTHSFLRDYVLLPDDALSTATQGAFAVQAATALGALSLRPSSTVTGFLFVLTLGCLVVGGASGLGPREARRLVGGLVVIGLVVAAIAVAQRPAPREPIYGFWEARFSSNVFGPFVNRNHFAGWMLMAVSLGLGYLMALASRRAHDVGQGWRNRILWLSSPQANHVLLVGLALAVMGLALVLTLSRSGIASFGVALLIVGACVIRRAPTRTRRIAVAGYLAVLAVATVGWTGVAAISTRFAVADVSFAGRLDHWRDAIEVVRRFPLTGTGLNTYTAVTPFFQDGAGPPSSDEAHNDYLQLAAEGGLLLGVPATCLVLLFAREVRRRLRASALDPASYWLRMGAVAGLLAIALQETVEFSLQLPGNALLFAVLGAVAVHRPEDPVLGRTAFGRSGANR